MTLLETAHAPAAFPTARPNLAGMTRSEIASALRDLGLPEREIRMRTNQLWHWIYFRGARDFADMLNISKTLRSDAGGFF